MITQQEFTERLQALTRLFKQDGLDGFVVTSFIDQFYLTNVYFYLNGEAVFLAYDGGLACFVRQLYVEPLRRKYPFLQLIGQDKDKPQAAAAMAAKLGLKQVGFDAAKESYLTGCLFKQAGFVEAKSYLALLRRVKTAREIEAMRVSGRIAQETYEYIRPLIKEGMSELEVAAEMDKYMRLRGASGPSFPTLVAFGENTANPHHESSSRILKQNEAVLLDFGCIYQGYCSDMTRSWWFGNQEPEEYTKIWTLTDQAQKAGIAAEKPGIWCRDVDAAARQIITQGGYGEYFTHRLGHGVGLEIHEEPCNDQTSPDQLTQGNVLTVEPGIYLPGKFGVRLEETTVITETGADILTRK